ncbi:hypothetical protein BaRGS_00034533 [Batillaria attramentaria]|uniref:Uncharacterized protein n=1 Tax=Batillaria attramentaria TaxID=370345 RepID=A0ABD0JHU8_9CAEN
MQRQRETDRAYKADKICRQAVSIGTRARSIALCRRRTVGEQERIDRIKAASSRLFTSPAADPPRLAFPPVSVFGLILLSVLNFEFLWLPVFQFY